MTTPDDTRETRSLQQEVEVPGTPEQVWEAIATGPGITAWFIPTEVDEREGGTVTMRHGPDMDSSAKVTAWDPPRRFAYEEDQWQPTEAASPERIATEWLVEARSGGTCVVRVVMSGFGSGADWDRAIESFESGWRQVLLSLRLYLTNFPGQRCSPITVGASIPGPHDRAWAELTGALGLPDAAEGERTATSAPDAPALAGQVVRRADRMLTLLLDEPAPGIGLIGAGGPGDEVFTVVRAQLFGDDAPAVAARDEPAWRAWMDEHFPQA
jgi:uncharacterized protein YndB with AHSA1/START domain